MTTSGDPAPAPTRDTSERTRREAAAEQTRMIARFSHEIRSPLHTILGVAELLATNTDLTDEQRGLINTITNESQVLRSMIDDILDLSRLSAGQMELAAEVFSPSVVLDEIGQSFRHPCHDKGLDFSVRVDATIPPTVRGDARRLRQILVNLLSNAVRYTSRGFVRVEATANVDGSLRFRVSDSGAGIPRELRSTIFEPFTRGDDAQGRESEGAGLGLAITKQLVELMDGALGFETGDDGTSFWCDIAFGHARRASDLRPSEPPKMVTAPSGAHVLVVDDSEVNRLLASSQLDRLGYSHATARGGEEALDRLRTEHYDAVLMDWHMPGLDGLQATTQWRANETGRSPLPIIVMTASAMAGDRERCLDAGASDYLSKPVSITDLGATLAKWTAPTGAVAPFGEPTSFDLGRVGTLIDDLGGADVARSILDAFLETTPQYRESAREALISGDDDTVRRCAHTLKSTAKMLGAGDLATACEELEAAAGSADLHRLVDTFDRRCQEAEREFGDLASTLSLRS